VGPSHQPRRGGSGRCHGRNAGHSYRPGHVSAGRSELVESGHYDSGNGRCQIPKLPYLAVPAAWDRRSRHRNSWAGDRAARFPRITQLIRAAFRPFRSPRLSGGRIGECHPACCCRVGAGLQELVAPPRASSSLAPSCSWTPATRSSAKSRGSSPGACFDPAEVLPFSRSMGPNSALPGHTVVNHFEPSAIGAGLRRRRLVRGCPESEFHDR
jgi:hypothetical protein